MKPFSTIKEAISDFKKGKFLIVVDDENRENEGDLVVAAEKITHEQIGFMIKYTSGVICVPMEGKRLDRLQIPMMHYALDPYFQTPFTLSVDAANGTSGISASSRLETIKHLADPKAQTKDFVMPGHIFPLRSNPNGVLGRAGHTEASVDLARLAKVSPVAVLAELVDEKGEIMRLSALISFAKQHGLRLISIKDLISYQKSRSKIGVSHEPLQKITLSNKAQLPTAHGMFTIATVEHQDKNHLVLAYGDKPFGQELLVRVHSSCTTSEIFGSLKCDCKEQIDYAMHMIANHGSGILIYLYQEGRGIGLVNKIKAYALQDKGFDTVEANRHLGFTDDLRDYKIAAEILHELGLSTIRLLTNNPDKVKQLEKYGIAVVEQIPIKITPGEYNKHYLATKKEKLGHLL